MPWGVYGCGCIWKVTDSGNLDRQTCPWHEKPWGAAIRVSHETLKWAEKTPEYQKNRDRDDIHHPEEHRCGDYCEPPENWS